MANANARPMIRVEEVVDLTKQLPARHANFHQPMRGVMIIQEVISAEQMARQRLDYITSKDRMLMEKYREMEKYVDSLQHLKIVSPENSAVMNKIVELINVQNRNETLNSLCNFHNIVRSAIEHNGEGIKNFFDASFLKIDTIFQNPNPLVNHTLRRTFQQRLESLNAVDIKVKYKYNNKQCQILDKVDDEIPQALQGEIAGLSSKFRISVDPTRIIKSTIPLMCYLEDDLLPDVPPLYIDVPEKYPYCSPTCITMQHEYSLTPFLTTVQRILVAYISKLPKIYSLTHVLNSWEMSVRKACGPQNQPKFCSFNVLYEMMNQ